MRAPAPPVALPPVPICPPVSLPPKDIMESVIPIWRDLGLPPLQLRTPWYGYDLGWWSEVEKEAGMLAIEGRYYETGKKMERARIAAPTHSKTK